MPRAKRVGDRRLVLRNCVVDEDRPLGVVLQEEISNHLRLLRSKTVVVSSEGKRLGRVSGQVTPRKRNDSEPLLLMSKRTKRYQNRGLLEARGISSDGNLLTGGVVSGI